MPLKIYYYYYYYYIWSHVYMIKEAQFNHCKIILKFLLLEDEKWSCCHLHVRFLTPVWKEQKYVIFPQPLNYQSKILPIKNSTKTKIHMMKNLTQTSSAEAKYYDLLITFLANQGPSALQIPKYKRTVRFLQYTKSTDFLNPEARFSVSWSSLDPSTWNSAAANSMAFLLKWHLTLWTLSACM